MSTDLFSKVKLALRITGADLDDEIQDMIDVVHEDMLRVRIRESVQTETALGREATIAYCRSRYETEPEDRAAYMESYQSMLDTLRRSSLYYDTDGGAGNADA